MASYDRKFDVVRPSLDRLVRTPLEVADAALINPQNANAIIDGEFVTHDANYKFIRATDPALPCFATLEWRGDYGVQASKKLSTLYIGGYEADTLVFDPTTLTLGSPLMLGTVNTAATGSVNRSGIVDHDAVATKLVLGYVTRLPATNGNRLRFLQVMV